MTDPHLIILYREDDEGATVYKETISSKVNHAIIQCCPVLSTQLQNNISLCENIAKDGLSLFYNYYGVILTSSRSAMVFRQLWKDAYTQSQTNNTKMMNDNPILMNNSKEMVTSSTSSSTLINNNNNNHIHDINYPPFPCFVVGTKTAAILDGLPFIQIYGAESGNAASLVPVILDYGTKFISLSALPVTDRTIQDNIIHANSTKSFLFLRGDKALDTIPKALQSNNWKCEELIVYQTCNISIEEFTPRWKEIVNYSNTTQIHELPWKSINFVIFSPSGFETILQCTDMGVLLQNNQIITYSNHPQQYSKFKINIIAIGNTTATAIKNKGYTVDGIANTPDANGVSDVLQNILK